ncbi:MAG: hypothetical protein D6776_03120 [Planctomycetota bacterium]|nr:MAG: hypothetical protein D6776_03120 [Planctomycetota bacterium]
MREAVCYVALVVCLASGYVPGASLEREQGREPRAVRHDDQEFERPAPTEAATRADEDGLQDGTGRVIARR